MNTAGMPRVAAAPLQARARHPIASCLHGPIEREQALDATAIKMSAGRSKASRPGLEATLPPGGPAVSIHESDPAASPWRRSPIQVQALS